LRGVGVSPSSSDSSGWIVERLAVKAPLVNTSNHYPEVTALSLMLAVITASDTPLVLLDGELKVVAPSASFCPAFGIDPGSVPGRRLSEHGDGWAGGGKHG
jgi:hypothetical protein